MSSPQEAYSRCHKGLTLFSDEPHPRDWFTFHYRNPSRRIPEPFTTLLGAHTHNSIGGSQNVPKLHNRSLRGTSKPSRVHNAPKRQQALGNTMHPRVTSFSTSIFTYHRRESNPMQLMQEARTHEVVKSFTLKFQPSNKCFGGNKRGRTKGMNTKQPQI